MEKNKKAIIYVLILLVGIGLSFAYFVGRTLFDGEGAMTHATTATINNAEITVEGNIVVDKLDMLPGHKMVSYLKVIAKGNNELIPFNLIWKGINGLDTTLKVTVYKADKPNNELNVEAKCEEIRKKVSAGIMVYEECDIINLNTLGTPVGNGEIITSEEEAKVTLAKDQFINAIPSGEETYYYVVLEYPNDTEGSQNSDMGEHFEGEVTVEASNTEPDIDIMAIYVEDEEGTFNKQEEIPEGNYILDTKQTVCNNGAISTWDYVNKRLTIDNLTKSGTSCYLYFSKKFTSEETLAKLFSSFEIKNSGTNFTKDEVTGILKVTGTDIGDNKNVLYEAEDNDGTSYFFRGNAQNNYVKFAGYYWRIIRINGDGTIRIIYDGKSAHMNGESSEDRHLTTDEGNISNSAYNLVADDNTYVGYYNFGDKTSNYDEAHNGTNPSTIATVLNTWYLDNIGVKPNLAKWVDLNTGFCIDRSIASESQTWWDLDTKHGYGTDITAYGPMSRISTESRWLNPQTPTLMCGDSKSSEQYLRDYLTPKSSIKGKKQLDQPIGLITVDEVILAGGFAGADNKNFYLYTGQHYWAISPWAMDTDKIARVAYVNLNGSPNRNPVNALRGVRPVINLKASTNFTTNDGDDKGTVNNPYVVVTE